MVDLILMPALGKKIVAFKFEKLEIWQLAILFSDEVHSLTRKFPKEEMFALSSQFNRAADSIALNIAEGSIGLSNPEQKKFIGYAIRSLAESVTCLHLARRRNYVRDDIFENFYNRAEILIAKMIRLRTSLTD